VGVIDDSPCSCGRKYRRLRGLEGRRVRYAKAGEERSTFSPDLIRGVIDTFPLAHYQIVQTAPEHIVVRIVPQGETPSDMLRDVQRRRGVVLPDSMTDEELVAHLVERMRPRLPEHIQADVQICQLAELLSAAGKLEVFVTELDD
jgi:phenylacetate-coenzyme A ligase PaaK-like adenylate-forming protein